jgi:hypothetical protein
MNGTVVLPTARRTNGVAEALVPSRLDDIIFARLIAARGRRSEAELARELRPLAPSTYNDARWFAAVEQSAARLRAAGGRGKGPRRPSAAGQVGKRFGLRKGATWKHIHERVLPGLALAIASGDIRVHARLKGQDDWAAAVVARFRGIWRQGLPPSCDTVCDALVWQALGLVGRPKGTPPELRAHFLQRLLGHAEGPPRRLLRFLAARDVGAVRSDLRGLREALSRRWLVGAECNGRAEPQTSGLSEFAAVVRQAAAQASSGVFGRHKVFIAPLWRSLHGHPAVADLTLDQFKRQLVAAHRSGLLVLARADLVTAMDPQDVAESRTDHLEAQYHFVDREGTP